MTKGQKIQNITLTKEQHKNTETFCFNDILEQLFKVSKLFNFMYWINMKIFLEQITFWGGMHFKYPEFERDAFRFENNNILQDWVLLKK